jgi:hypothetical protein
MPLLLREGRLVVALEDPSKRAAIDEVEFSAEMKVLPVLARCTSFETVLHAAYEKIGSAIRNHARRRSSRVRYEPVIATTTDMLVETLEKEGERATDDERPIEQSDNSLVRLLNNMIIEAHRDGVSDIHIESYPGREKIRVPLPQGRPAAHLPRAAVELPQRDHRARQDHVRPRHLRAPQAAGRQDQLREVLAAAPASSCGSRRSRPTAASRTSCCACSHRRGRSRSTCSASPSRA